MMLMKVTISGRPRGPSGSTSGRGEDDGITILPIIGGLVLGAGLLAFAYYHLSQKPECKKKIEKAKRIISPKILPSRRKWPIEEDECEAEIKQRRKEKEELNRLELERAEAELEQARLNQNAKPRCPCVSRQHFVQIQITHLIPTLTETCRGVPV